MKSGSEEELTKLLGDTRLTRVAAKLKALARPAIRLEVTPSKDATKLGASRAGGVPDLEVGAAFPRWDDDHALSFLLQVNLADIAKLDAEKLLPEDGLLSFFVGENIDEVEYLSECTVIYTPKGKKLAPCPYPDKKTTERYKPAALSFSTSLSLPPTEWPIVGKLRLKDEESEAYNDDVYNQLGYGTWKGGYFQMLGYERNPYSDTPGDKQECLLCVSSFEKIGWEWGDGNRLGFYLSQKHLKNQKFGEASSMYIDAG